jgi:hypothetical protein
MVRFFYAIVFDMGYMIFLVCFLGLDFFFGCKSYIYIIYLFLDIFKIYIFLCYVLYVC